MLEKGSSKICGRVDKLLFIMFVVVIDVISSAPVNSDVTTDVRGRQEKYLRQFGYIKPTSGPNPGWGDPPVLQDLGGPGDTITDETFSKAVRQFQKMAGLPQTGQVDERTEEMMARPRCGVPDVITPSAQGSRKKRFVLAGSRWPTDTVGYHIGSYVRPELNFSKEDVISEIRKSFKYWSDVSPLTFIESDSTNAEIQMNFVPRVHGDGYPLDGPGGVLAHTFYPGGGYGGDVHFDMEERWTTNSYSGTNLLYVSTHELGHALGLAHSDSGLAVMAPFYRAFNPNLQLSQDDINGIQSLYGLPRSTSTTASTTTTLTTTTTPTTTTTTPTTTTSRSTPPRVTPPVTPKVTTTTTPLRTPSSRPNTLTPNLLFPRPRSVPDSQINPPQEWCQNPTVDAVINMQNVAYFFKGDKYAAVDDFGILPGYPKSIQETWPQAPTYLDDALYWEDLDQIYFFKGDQVWRFNGKTELDIWYPKPVWSKFVGLPGNINAAFIYSGNNATYFIKGDQYYRYNRNIDAVESGYPQSTSIWSGLPASNLNAAFQWSNRRTYFFSGKNYYRYNDQLFETDRGYPRPTAVLWFKCDDRYST